MTPAVGYTEMRDSGFPDIGCVPSAWTIMKVKHIFDVICGATPKENPENWDGNIPWIGPSDMPMTGTIEHGKRFISELGYASCGTTLVPQNSIIISTRAPIGKICIAANRLCTNQGCKALVPRNKSINNRFFAYYLRSIIERLEVDGTGTTFKELSTSKLLNEPLIAPPISEQSAIAAYLDTQCAKIDEIIAEAKASIEDYKQWKASIIYEAVTKGLDPKAEMKDSGIEWIGEIPMGWEIKKAKKCVTITNGADPKTEGNIPVYGSGAESFKTCGEYKEGPTVLIGRKGATLHIPHYITGRYWNVDTAFDAKAKVGFSLKYYYFLAYSFDYKYYISQTTLPSMTQTNYNNIFLPVPPKETQDLISRVLSTRIEKIDAYIDERKSLVTDLESYKKSLIYEVVTGKRRVC